MKRALLFASLTLSLAAQTPAPQAAPEPKSAPAPTEVTTTVKPNAPDPKAPVFTQVKEDETAVLATIGQQVVRVSDFNAFLGAVINNPQQRLQLELAPGTKDRYRQQFMEFMLIAAKARKQGIHKSEAFKRKCAVAEMQFLVEEMMHSDGKTLMAKATPTDDEVKAFFDKDPKAFQKPGSFSAQHILVTVKDPTAPNPSDKGCTEDEAKAKIAKIQEELKAGKAFEDLAKTYSDDPGSKEKGGLYEDIAFGQFVPEFEVAVQKQDVGQVGEPVRTKYGYHLIKVVKKVEAPLPTFEASKEAARQKLTQSRQEGVFSDYLAGLKQDLGFQEGPAMAKKHEQPAGKKADTTTNKQQPKAKK